MCKHRVAQRELGKRERGRRQRNPQYIRRAGSVITVRIATHQLCPQRARRVFGAIGVLRVAEPERRRAIGFRIKLQAPDLHKIAHGARAVARAQRCNGCPPEKIDPLAAVFGDLVDLVIHRQRARGLSNAHQVFGQESANLLPLLQRGAFDLTVQNGGAAPLHVRGFSLA